MENEIHRCEQPDCSNLAQCFFLPQKEKACQSHSLAFTQLGLKAYPIEAFQFVDSEEDALEYDRRKQLVEVGLRNADRLETRLSFDKEKSLQTLENHQVAAKSLISQLFEEAQEGVHTKCKEAETTIVAVREECKQFVQKKDARLGRNGKLICEEAKCTPKFLHVATTDVAEKLIENLKSSIHVVNTPVEADLQVLSEDGRAAAIERLHQEAGKRGVPEFAEEAEEYTKQVEWSEAGERKRCPEFKPLKDGLLEN